MSFFLLVVVVLLLIRWLEQKLARNYLSDVVLYERYYIICLEKFSSFFFCFGFPFFHSFGRLLTGTKSIRMMADGSEMKWRNGNWIVLKGQSNYSALTSSLLMIMYSSISYFLLAFILVWLLEVIVLYVTYITYITYN